MILVCYNKDQKSEDRDQMTVRNHRQTARYLTDCDSRPDPIPPGRERECARYSVQVLEFIWHFPQLILLTSRFSCQDQRAPDGAEGSVLLHAFYDVSVEALCRQGTIDEVGNHPTGAP